MRSKPFARTQTHLEDQSGRACGTTTEFTMSSAIVWKPFVQKRPLRCPIRDIPLAVYVPMNPTGVIPARAFVAVPRLRLSA